MNNVLQSKSFAFSVRIVNLYKFLQTESKEFIISKQLFRAGTNPGAMIREAKVAESAKDFIHKLSIALKEIEESIYWLDLLFATKYLEESLYKSLKNDAIEIAKLLTASIKTRKRNIQR